MNTFILIFNSEVSVVSSIAPVPGSLQIIPHDSEYDTNCKWYVVFHVPIVPYWNKQNGWLYRDNKRGEKEK